MKIYLTRTRWNALTLADAGAHPRPLTVDILTNELGLSTRDATATLNGMAHHGIVVCVGGEYRFTRVGAELVQRVRTGTINDVTLEIDDAAS